MQQLLLNIQTAVISNINSCSLISVMPEIKKIIAHLVIVC